MALKIGAKFEGKLTYAYKKWHEEFGKFSFQGSKIAISFRE